MKQKQGFTLAEVLITLGVIGIVAALTIPTLINSYQKQTYVTQLKKAYLQFTEALKLLTKDYDCPNNIKCTGIFGTGTSNQAAGDEIVKYFKIVKNCRTDENGCFSNNVSADYNGISPRTDAYDSTDVYRFITADGTSFYIDNMQNDCMTQINDNLSQCGEIFVDVNGPSKGPNNIGRDIFYFYITGGNGPLLYPAGAPTGVMLTPYWNDGITPSCTEDGISMLNSSYGCTGRIMEENWQMNY